MKKIILGLTIGLLLISCSSSSSDSSSSGAYRWQFKLNGVLYQWSGSLQDPGGGGGNYVVGGGMNTLVLTKTTPQQMSVSIVFPTASTGNFTFNSSSPGSLGMSIIIQNPNNFTSDSYLTGLGGSMNVNISSLSSTTLLTNPTNPGKVIGTFSGTIQKGGGQLATITDGLFEVYRAQ